MRVIVGSIYNSKTQELKEVTQEEWDATKLTVPKVPVTKIPALNGPLKTAFR